MLSSRECIPAEVCLTMHKWAATKVMMHLSWSRACKYAVCPLALGYGLPPLY